MAFDWDAHIREQVNEFNRKLMMPTQSLGYAGGGAVQRHGLDVRQQPTTPALPPTLQPTITIGISADRQPGTSPVTPQSLNPPAAVSADKQPTIPVQRLGLADGGPIVLNDSTISAMDSGMTAGQAVKSSNPGYQSPSSNMGSTAPSPSIGLPTPSTGSSTVAPLAPNPVTGSVTDPLSNMTTLPGGNVYYGPDFNATSPLPAGRKPDRFAVNDPNARLGLANSGVIPGKVDPTVADDVTINAKRGEYIFSPEVVAALGGPQVLDALAASVKQSIGLPPTVGPKMHNEPDAMGRMDKPGLADGGGVDEELYSPQGSPLGWQGGEAPNPDDLGQVVGLPAGPQPAAAAPTPLLKVSAGDTATGYAPAVEINSGNVDKYAGMKAARGVVANTPNNMPDLANTVKSMQDDGTGAKLSDAVVGMNASPQVIMHGPLDDAAAQALSNRVDWSPGSENVKQVGINAKYSQEVADAARINKINEEQRLNRSVADRVVDMNRNYNYDQLSSAEKLAMAQDSAARDASVFKEKQAAEITAANLAETKRLNDATIEKDKSIATKNIGLAKGNTSLKPSGVAEDGRRVFYDKTGQQVVQNADGEMEPYSGKVSSIGADKMNINVNAADRDQVDILAKGVLDGTINPDALSKRGGLQAAVWSKVKELNPSADLVGLGAGAKFTQATGTMGTKALLNSIDPLLTKLEQAGGVLQNSNIPALNRAKNFLKEQTGNADIVGFNNLRDDVIAEVERGLLGTGVLSDSKYNRALKNVNSAHSLPQLKAAVANMKVVINARLEALHAGPNAPIPGEQGVPKVGMPQPSGNSPEIAPAGLKVPRRGGGYYTSDGKGGWK